MAQVLRPDIIGDLSKTSGTLLTLAAGSYVTVGGQQYTNSAALTVNTATVGAGGLDTGVLAGGTTYFVYGVVSGAALALVASLSAISPTGFTAYKLIGAFQTTNLAAIDYVFSIAQSPGEPLRNVPGVETRLQSIIYPEREYKNLAINGNFDFWQRGTSLALTASQFVADRFRTFHNGTFVGLITNSRSTDVPTVAESGFASTYSYSMTKPGGALGGGAGDYIFISHNIEGYNYDQIHGAKNFRVQFWVKSSVAGVYSVSLNNSATDRVMVRDYTIPAPNVWQRVAMDFVSDNSGTWNLLNGVGLQVGFVLAVGSGNSIAPSNSWTSAASKFGSSNQTNWAGQSNTSFNIAQVQVIPGLFTPDVAPTFRRTGADISDELRMCQRYYEKSYDVDTVPGTSTAVGLWTATVRATSAIATNSGPVHFLVQKRTAPAGLSVWPQDGSLAGNINFSGGGTGEAGASSEGNGQHGANLFLNGTASGLTTGDAVTLFGHWAVDTEL